jgi:hypothetical protein
MASTAVSRSKIPTETHNYGASESLRLCTAGGGVTVYPGRFVGDR